MGNNYIQTALCPVCDTRMDVKDCRGVRIEHVLVRRRRVCSSCGFKCTTHEVIVHGEESPSELIARKITRFHVDMQKLIEKTFGEELSVQGNFKSEGKKL